MLTYIHRAEICPAYHLAANTDFISRPAGAVSFGGAYIPWKPLPLLGLAQLSVSATKTDGELRSTSKLTAYLSREWRGADEPVGAWALRLTDSDGQKLILGLSSEDAPAIAVASERPSSAASAVRFTFTAEWLAAPLAEITGE